MGLPTVPLARSSIEIGGEAVEFRSLSRSEVIELGEMTGDAGTAEVYVLARACGITEAEAQAWRDEVDATTAGDLLAAIREVSGLGNRPASRSPSSAD